jgi:hypothetical protein
LYSNSGGGGETIAGMKKRRNTNPPTVGLPCVGNFFTTSLLRKLHNSRNILVKKFRKKNKKEYSVWESNPRPEPCEGSVITNYTNGAVLMFANLVQKKRKEKKRKEKRRKEKRRKEKRRKEKERKEKERKEKERKEKERKEKRKKRKRNRKRKNTLDNAQPTPGLPSKTR